MKNNIYIYVCVIEALCCTLETNTTLQTNCTSIKKEFQCLLKIKKKM